MVGPRVSLHVDAVTDRRWVAGLELLESGEATVGLVELALSSDPVTERTRRRLCGVSLPARPTQGDGSAPERLGGVATTALTRTRELIRECEQG